jgi:hypothetical protein
VPEALDDAALLQRIDSAIADGRRLLAELGQLRVAVTARIPAEQDLPAGADGDEADFRQHLMLWPSEAAQRFNFAVDTIRYLCRVQGLGRKYGNRWRASIPRFVRYINGGGC